MKTSYNESDVKFLLTDLTGLIDPMSAEDRERLIEQGEHYATMLPEELCPSDEEIEMWQKSVKTSAPAMARYIEKLAQDIISARLDDNPIALVSLVRAGTPVGILLKRFMDAVGVPCEHYSISIIKGFGIDKNAMNTINREGFDEDHIFFVDGWTGKGSIRNELNTAALGYFTNKPKLAVIADPAGVADFYATPDDVYIPTCYFNSIVTGLISRSIYRSDLIDSNAYHGAVYFSEFEGIDQSYYFIDQVWIRIEMRNQHKSHAMSASEEIKDIIRRFDSDLRHVRPGFGEAIRVLLRKVPKCIIVSPHISHEELQLIKVLAKKKHVPIMTDDIRYYKVYGIMEVVNCEE